MDYQHKANAEDDSCHDVMDSKFKKHKAARDPVVHCVWCLIVGNFLEIINTDEAI